MASTAFTNNALLFAGESLAFGSFDGCAEAIDGRVTLKDCGQGACVSEPIDAGQAVVWERIHWDAEVPEGCGLQVRTRFAGLRENLENAKWSRPYSENGAEIRVASYENMGQACAARYFQFRLELTATGETLPSVSSLSVSCRLPQPSGHWPMDKCAVHPDDLELRWLPVKNAAFYQVQTAHDPHFTANPRVFSDISDHRFVPPKDSLPASGPVFWRVRAADGTGKWSDWSALREVALSGRRLSSEYDCGPHPRLFMDQAQLADLRKKAESDPATANACRLIREKADAALDLVVPTEQESLETEGLHLKFFDLWIEIRKEALENLAFTYLMGGDEKYARAARRIMLSLVAYEKWTSMHFRNLDLFNPEWIATLETAAMTKGVGIAYDWLHGWLSEEDRTTIRDGLVRVGIRPLIHDWCDPDTFWRIPAHQQPSGNWWGVCNGCAGIGALSVLGEEPKAHKWLRMAEDAVCWHVNYRGGDVINREARADAGYENLCATEPNFGVDFGYPESIGYIMYGLTHDLLLMEALKKATGTDIAPYFDSGIMNEPLYGMYHDTQRGWGSLNFNDSGDGPVQADGSVLFAKHARDPRIQWMFEQCQGAPDTIHSLLALDASVISPAPDDLPGIKLFRDIGWAIFRTGWGHRDSTFAAKFHQGRGHADLGQFVVYHKGGRQVMESGTLDYHEPVYHQFLSQTQAHNVVMIDGRQQNRLDGKVTGFLAGDGVGLAQADLTIAYEDLIDSWNRGLGFFDEGIYLVWDRVRAGVPHDYSWLLHPESGFRADGTAVEMGANDARLGFHLLSDRELRVETLPGYLSYSHKAIENPYLSYNAEGTESADFLAVFADGEFTSFARLGPTIAEIASTDTVCFASLGNCSAIGPITVFEGVFLAAIRDREHELPAKLLASGCRRHKMPGFTLLAENPVNLVLHRTGNALRIRTSGRIQIDADPTLKVAIEEALAGFESS